MDTSKGHPVPGDADFTLGDLLANRHPAWLFLEYAAQRAVLNHPSTRVFLTHAGPSSANEALYHGVPMISMPVYGDQRQYSMRLVAAGVALSINKDHFSPAELCALVAILSMVLS
jgi:UDP:flavonoid glycosyltransferase YjiC (YdhE family)